MLTDYIWEALQLAHYELMENGRFFATIPGLKGLWAEEATLEACREELQSTLEDWLMLKLRLGDKDFPTLGGIDVNSSRNMPKPISWRELSRRMRLFGWAGPEAERVMARCAKVHTPCQFRIRFGAIWIGR